MTDNDPDSIVEFVKISKVYPPDVLALVDISFKINRGEMIFLTGMSGAGKTTIIKLICNIERPTKGFIDLDGNDLNKIKPAAMQLLRQKIGVAYQDFRLLPRLTVFQNIAMALEVKFLDGRTIRDRVGEVLDILKMSDKIHKRTDKLSRGEQQRVAIARAAAPRPLLLLADEPTGNLDDQAGKNVMELFSQLNNQGTTVIIATHDQSIYQDSPCRIFNLENGNLRIRSQNHDPGTMPPEPLNSTISEPL